MSTFVEKQSMVINNTWAQLKPFSRKLNREKVLAILAPMYSTAFAEGYGHGKAEMTGEFSIATNKIFEELYKAFGTTEEAKEILLKCKNDIDLSMLPWK